MPTPRKRQSKSPAAAAAAAGGGGGGAEGSGSADEEILTCEKMEVDSTAAAAPKTPSGSSTTTKKATPKRSPSVSFAAAAEVMIVATTTITTQKRTRSSSLTAADVEVVEATTTTTTTTTTPNKITRGNTTPKRSRSSSVGADEGDTADATTPSSSSARRSRSSAGTPKAVEDAAAEAPDGKKKRSSSTGGGGGGGGVGRSRSQSSATKSKADDDADDDDESADLLTRCPTRMGLSTLPPTSPPVRTIIPHTITERAMVPPGLETWKAMVWNVCGLRALLRNGSSELKRLMEQEQPNVLGFNETKIQEDHVEEVTKKLHLLLPDYDVHLACSKTKKGYSGVGALVHKSLGPRPLGVVNGMGVSVHDDEGRCISLEYPQFHLVFVYVPNSGEPIKLPRLPYRTQQWDPDLRAYLASLKRSKPVILMGDLNVAHLDSDFYNPHEKRMLKTACTTPEERGNFGVMLAEGYVDTWRAQHPEATGCFSQWSVRAGNRPFNRGNRFDYAVASQELCSQTGTPRVIDSFIRNDFGVGLSDHCPVGVTLGI